MTTNNHAELMAAANLIKDFTFARCECDPDTGCVPCEYYFEADKVQRVGRAFIEQCTRIERLERSLKEIESLDDCLAAKLICESALRKECE